MRYLNKRDEFLNRSLTKINEYNKIQLNDYEQINEEMESGPFANDIPWGDSILGRMINSAIRKAKIGANLLRIKTVEQRLRDAFDEILYMSKINENEEDSKNFKKIINLTYLYNLEKAVKEKEEIKVIKNLCNTAITEVEKDNEIPEREELLAQLKAFKEFLDSLKESEEPKEKEKDNNYDTYLENFKYVFAIVQEYAKLKSSKPIPQKSEKTELEVGKEYVFTDAKGNKSIVKLLDKEHQREVGPDKKWLTGDDVIKGEIKPKVYVISKNKKTKEYDSGMPPYAVDPSQLSSKTENYSFVNEQNSEETTPKILILKPIKSLYDYFNQDKGETIKDLDTFFKSGNDYKNNPKFKSPIEKIYKRIKLKGGIKEGINEFLTRPEVIGDKIFELYKITKTKENGEFEGINDSMKKSVAEFNRTMKSIITTTELPKKEEPVDEGKPIDKEEEKGSLIGKAKDQHQVQTGENLFTKYSDFMKIYETELVGGVDMTTDGGEDDNKAVEEKPIEKETTEEKPTEEVEDNKILAWWNKNMDLKKWMGSKEETEKIKENLDKKLEEKQDSCTIYGMDPVLEIVKCFNRAYKLHTTQVIETGRHEGLVSNSVFMEYTCFGNGSPANAGRGGGPYRNNAIFNQWERTVLDIKGDRKYQPIFSMSTRLKVGDEYIEKAGANLRKFMTDMLDGEELYKGGKEPGGAQAKFLDKYFGYKVEGTGKDIAYNGATELETNDSNSPKENNLQFVDNPISFGKYTELDGSFFAIETKNNEGKDVNLYFYIQKSKGDMLYVIYSNTMWFFWKYIMSSGKASNLLRMKGKMRDIKQGHEDKTNTIKATKIRAKELIQADGKYSIAPNSHWEFTFFRPQDGVNKNKNLEQGGPDKYLVQKIFTLADLSTSGVMSTPKNMKRFVAKWNEKIKLSAQENGGFTMDISDGGFKISGGKSLADSADVIIKKSVK